MNMCLTMVNRGNLMYVRLASVRGPRRRFAVPATIWKTIWWSSNDVNRRA